MLDSTHNKKQLSGYFGYVLSDKCKDEAAKETALSMKKEYDGLDTTMATAFAQKFMDTRKSKDFSWHKSFSESFATQKEEAHGVKENHLTLTLPQLTE